MLNFKKHSLHYLSTLVDQQSRSPTQRLTLSLLISIAHNQGESFITSYKQNQLDPAIKQNYFKVLVQLHSFCLSQGKQSQSKIISVIIQELLVYQNNHQNYLNLLPQKLFLQVKNYNPRTYFRREKKVMHKNEGQIVRATEWQQHTQGYAQIILNLNDYFIAPGNDPSERWEVIIGIVGKYDLDFDRVTQLVVQYIYKHPNIDKVLPFCSLLNLDKLKSLLTKGITPRGEPTIQLLFSKPPSVLIEQSPRDLYKENIISFNPQHLSILYSLIQKGLFSLEELFQSLPTSTEFFHLNLYSLNTNLYKQKTDKMFLHSTQQSTQNSNAQDCLLLMGQITKCFKFAIMPYYVLNNQFQVVKDILHSLSPRRPINLSIYVPLLSVLCQLLEWIIDPLLEMYGYASFFASKRVSNNTFPLGYFKQSSRLDEHTFEQINQLLEYMEINIGYSTRTFITLTRCFKLCLQKPKDPQSYRFLKQEISKIIKKYLLGAFSMQDKNYLLVIQVNRLLSHYSQLQRIAMYNYHTSNKMLNNLQMLCLFQRGIQQDLVHKRIGVANYHLNILKTASNQYNHPFPSCSFALQSIINTSAETQAFVIDLLQHSNPLTHDLMLYLAIEYLANNEDILMTYYDIPTPKHRIISQLILTLFTTFHNLQFTFLLEVIIGSLKEYAEEPPASEENILHYNPNFFFLKTLALILEASFPLAQIDALGKDIGNERYLFYGYYMKSHMSLRGQSLLKYEEMRSTLYDSLSSKSPNGRTYLSQLLQHLNHHLKLLNSYNPNHQQDATKSIIKHSCHIDQCVSMINLLTKFYSIEHRHQYILYLKEIIPQRPNRQLIPVQQVLTLAKQHKIDIAFTSLFLRSIYQSQFQDNNFSQLKQKWHQITHLLADSIAMGSLFFSHNKVKAFMMSDFYFFFWLSHSHHLVSLQQEYCNKITQIRRQLQSISSQNASNEGQKQTFKKVLSLTLSLIVDQKQQQSHAYQKYNALMLPSYGQPLSTKMTLPQQYQIIKNVKTASQDRKQIQKKLKQFSRIFMSSCLLPRLLIDPSEALYCSRFLIKTMHDNKIPSNKSILLIFFAIETAVDYVQFSTEREAGRCIAVFVNDLLRMFKYWDNSQIFSKVLLQEIDMEKMTEKRIKVLMEFLSDKFTLINKQLLIRSHNLFAIKNTMVFIENTPNIPLSYEHGIQILSFLEQLSEQPGEKSVNIRARKMQVIIRQRIKRVPTMETYLPPKQRIRNNMSQNTPRSKQVFQPKSNSVIIDLQDPSILANIEPVQVARSYGYIGVKRQL